MEFSSTYFFTKNIGQIFMCVLLSTKIIIFYETKNAWICSKFDCKILIDAIQTGRNVELIFQCMLLFKKMCIKQLEIASTCCPTFYDCNNRRCRLTSSFEKT